MVTAVEQSYELHGDQFGFVTDNGSKYMLLIGGLGSGKTFAGAVKAVNFIAEHPESKGVIMGPTYEMIAEGTLSVFQEVAPPGFLTYGPKRESISGGVLMRTANNSTIYVRSFDDPWKLRGLQLSWAWMDEPGQGEREGKDVGRVFQVLSSRMRDIKGGRQQIWLTSTPNVGSWLNDYWEDQETLPKDHRVYRIATEENQRNLPQDYIDRLGQMFRGALYRQEVQGMWVGPDNLVYRFTDEHKKWPPQSFKFVVAGVDFGWENNCAITVWGFDGDYRSWGLDEFYKSHSPIEEWIEKARQLRKQYEIVKFFCDPSQPALIQLMRRAGLPAAKHDPKQRGDKMARIAEINTRLCLRGDNTYGLYVHPQRMPNTVYEFKHYVGAPMSEHAPISEKPPKYRDDAMDSMEYAVCGGKALREPTAPIPMRWEFGGGTQERNYFAAR